MLDSANFNTGVVAIAKSVSILAVPGALGSIVGNGADALAIETPGTDVKIRNVVIRALGSGVGYGLRVGSVANLFLEGVTVERFGVGIRVSGAANVAMRGSLIKSNFVGIELAQSDGADQVLSIDDSTLNENLQSIDARANGTTGSIRVAVENSAFVGPGNFGNGMAAFAGVVASAAPIRASFVRTKFVSRGGSGGVAATSAGVSTIVAFSDCHFAGFPVNAAVQLNSAAGVGVLKSRGNNTLTEGTLNGATALAAQ